jgi:hypothetical protein
MRARPSCPAALLGYDSMKFLLKLNPPLWEITMGRMHKSLFLSLASGGLLFAGTCDSVFSTLGLVYDIVRVWV